MPAPEAPSQAYARGVAAQRWQADPGQQAALPELDRLQRELLASKPSSLLTRLAARWRPPVAVRGLYLWGSVGTGKTFLTDLLLASVPGLPAQRWHFHRFMGHVHARLRALPADTADTLAVVAAQLAPELRLLVLDEFHVGDIGDAMILGRLLEQLLGRGVTLVTTSNTPPADLYRDGLQRDSFLPCIALLQSHCVVLRLDSAQDYRLRHLTHAATYLTPLGADSEQALSAHFERLTGKPAQPAAALEVNERPIALRALDDGVAWFDFAALCETPRSAADYIEIARDFHTVLISGVPVLDARREDAARRFVHLVDEFYDRHVNLLLSADADPTTLYRGARHAGEFARTQSRLMEMQSAEYLAQEHRP